MPSFLLLFASLIGFTVLPTEAKHDYFLLGEAPGVKAWDTYRQGEDSISHAPLLRTQQQAIVALYLAPVLAKKTNLDDALTCFPLYEEPKATAKERLARITSGAKLSAGLADSLRFLRWRLQSADKHNAKKLTEEVTQYFAKYNAEAVKQNTTTCTDVMALSLEYGRRQNYIDQENLADLALRFSESIAATQAIKAEADATQKYENNIAEAHVLASLDRRPEASEHFSEALTYLRSKPAAHRPQTDVIRKTWLRTLDAELLKYEGTETPVMSEEERLAFKKNLNWLIDVAYLAKIDGRLNEAAYQFRRAFLLAKRYYPEQQSDYSYLAYDLGETLMWDEKFDESVYYFKYATDLREKQDPLSLGTVDTGNLWARALLRQGHSKEALDLFWKNLNAVAQRCKLKDASDAYIAENLKLTFGGTAPGARDRLHIPLVVGLVNYAKSASADDRRQIDDGLQGTIDTAIPLKQYDLAYSNGDALLSVRSQSGDKNNADAVMSVIWGMAYACDSSARPAKAIPLYDRLIKDYGLTMPKLLPYWYHGRGLDLELVGNHALGSKDIRAAVDLYKKKLEIEEDEESRDHLTWTIADLQYNLDQAKKYAPNKPDYAELPENNRWRLSTFPLKIYVGRDKESGFGGEINDLVHEAVTIWASYPSSPLKVEYVDQMSQADIYIERVTVYDDIPYGSAGRTSANFEHKGEVQTKIMTRAHVRVYCPSYDGKTWEEQDVPMSDFAKVQLKYLLVHELGHVFGLTHSPAGPDIMYWKSCAQKLSDRDMKTVNRIYRR